MKFTVKRERESKIFRINKLWYIHTVKCYKMLVK